MKRHGKIVSAAGVHAVAPKIAQIGNVLADEEWRAVTTELASHGRILSLFVRKDNAPATRMYEQMGFRKARDIILARMSKTKKARQVLTDVLQTMQVMKTVDFPRTMFSM